MAQTAKILAHGTLSSSVLTDLYTAPTNTTTRVTRLNIAMGSLANAVTLTIFDASANASAFFWNAVTLSANTSRTEFDFILEAGDKIRGRAATASDVDFIIMGIEND